MIQVTENSLLKNVPRGNSQVIFLPLNNTEKVVVQHTFSPSTKEAETDRSLWVQNLPDLQCECHDDQDFYIKKPSLENQENKQTKIILKRMILQGGSYPFSPFNNWVVQKCPDTKQGNTYLSSGDKMNIRWKIEWEVTAWDHVCQQDVSQCGFQELKLSVIWGLWNASHQILSKLSIRGFWNACWEQFLKEWFFREWVAERLARTAWR